MQKKKIFMLCYLMTQIVSASESNVTKESLPPLPSRGRIGQVECNRPTGYGIAEIINIKESGRSFWAQKTRESYWVKVKSVDLCSRDYTPCSLSTLGGCTQLGELAFQNSINTQVDMNELEYDQDGYLVNLKPFKNIDVVEAEKNLTTIRVIGVQEAYDWYMADKSSRR